MRTLLRAVLVLSLSGFLLLSFWPARFSLSEASLTAKITAKIALDDSLKARAIDITTEGSTVTVSWRVPSAAARNRALVLTRETAGVSAVIDRLEVVLRQGPG